MSIIAGASLAFGAAKNIAGAKAQNAAAKANRLAAIKASRQTNRDIALLQAQEKAAVATTVFDIERTVRGAQSVALVSAGEAGVTGQSVRDIVNDIDREGGEAISRTEMNLADRMAQLERDKIAGRDVTAQRIAAVPRASTFGTILNLGSTGLAFGNAAIAGNFFPKKPE